MTTTSFEPARRRLLPVTLRIAAAVLAAAPLGRAQFFQDLKADYIGTASTTLSPGQVITVALRVKNASIFVSSAAEHGLYLTEFSGPFQGTTTLLATWGTAALPPLTSETRALTVTIPATLTRRTCVLGMRVDHNNTVTEVNENNNTLIQSVTCAGGPDLHAIDLGFTAALHQGGAVPMTATVTNAGSMLAEQAPGVQTTDGIYLSTDSNVTNQDTLLWSRSWQSLAPGQTATPSGSMQIPATIAPGTYWLGYLVDDQGKIAEINETNNAVVVQVDVHPPEVAVCPSMNKYGVLSTYGANSEVVAPVVADHDLFIDAIRLHVGTPGGVPRVTTNLYRAAANGVPENTPAATGTMTVGAARWHTSALSPRVEVSQGEKFFIGFAVSPAVGTSSVYYSIAQGGTSADGFYRFQGPWRAWRQPYMYQVQCTMRGRTSTFGNGCPGTPAPIAGWNTSGGQFIGSAHSGTFGYETVATRDGWVTGFQYYTRAEGSQQVSVPAHLHTFDPVTGTPKPTPERSGTMVFSPRLEFQTARFANPWWVQAGQRFFVTVGPNTRFKRPFVNTGVTVRGTWWFFSGAWTRMGPTSDVSFRVLSDVPMLSYSSQPNLGETLTVDVDSAKEASPALLAIGGSEQFYAGLALPFDLTPLGAPGCNLQVSLDHLVPTMTSAAGRGTVGLAVPNTPSLAGGSIYNQWLVVDPGANALGITVSGAGRAIVGH